MSDTVKRLKLDDEDKTALASIEAMLSTALLSARDRLIDHSGSDDTIKATIETCSQCNQPHITFQFGKYGNDSSSLAKALQIKLNDVAQREATKKANAEKRIEPVAVEAPF